MLLALVLAVTTATPAPSSLAPLKVIASVRSTPLCSAMRTKIAPAIAALLENDATIDKAPAIFDRIYRNALLNASGGWEQWNARGFINRGNLEYLFGPLANNLKQIDKLLADNKVFVSKPVSDDDRRLAQIKNELNAIETQQKAALNVVSGYDATAQTWELLTTDKSQVLHVSSPSQRPWAEFNSAGFFSGAGNQNPGMMQGPRSTPGRFDISLTYNPFKSFAQYVMALRTQGDTAEAAAAAVITPIAASCQTK